MTIVSGVRVVDNALALDNKLESTSDQSGAGTCPWVPAGGHPPQLGFR
jgi:hypothetical protein